MYFSIPLQAILYTSHLLSFFNSRDCGEKGKAYYFFTILLFSSIVQSFKVQLLIIILIFIFFSICFRELRIIRFALLIQNENKKQIKIFFCTLTFIYYICMHNVYKRRVSMYIYGEWKKRNKEEEKKRKRESCSLGANTKTEAKSEIEIAKEAIYTDRIYTKPSANT